MHIIILKKNKSEKRQTEETKTKENKQRNIEGMSVVMYISASCDRDLASFEF